MSDGFHQHHRVSRSDNGGTGGLDMSSDTAGTEFDTQEQATPQEGTWKANDNRQTTCPQSWDNT